MNVPEIINKYPIFFNKSFFKFSSSLVFFLKNLWGVINVEMIELVLNCLN